MGRVYTATFNIAAFGTAAGDVFEITAITEKPLSIHEVIIAQQDSEVSEMLGIALINKATSGSGGSSITPKPLNPNNSATSVTVEAANTTDASGAATEHFRDAFNVLAGWRYVPLPEDRIIVLGTDTLVCLIPDIPTLNADFQITVTFEELV